MNTFSERERGTSIKQRFPDRKVRVVADTCFWIALAGLDMVNENFSQERKDERMKKTLSAFKYFLENRKTIEIVYPPFFKTELRKVFEKLRLRLIEAKASPQQTEEAEKKIKFLKGFVENESYVTEYPLHTWSYIRHHPDLPLKPEMENGKLRENPDRHLFAAAQMMRNIQGGFDESIILTHDQNHVVSAGVYKGTIPIGPENFGEVVSAILYKNGRDKDGRILHSGRGSGANHGIARINDALDRKIDEMNKVSDDRKNTGQSDFPQI